MYRCLELPVVTHFINHNIWIDVTWMHKWGNTRETNCISCQYRFCNKPNFICFPDVPNQYLPQLMNKYRNIQQCDIHTPFREFEYNLIYMLFDVIQIYFNTMKIFRTRVMIYLTIVIKLMQFDICFYEIVGFNAISHSTIIRQSSDKFLRRSNDFLCSQADDNEDSKYSLCFHLTNSYLLHKGL